MILINYITFTGYRVSRAKVSVFQIISRNQETLKLILVKEKCENYDHYKLSSRIKIYKVYAVSKKYFFRNNAEFPQYI